MAAKILKIKIIPNSKINKIVEEKEDWLKIKLTAPAHEGKANEALMNFLSQEYKIAKNKIQLVSGQKSRDKTVKLLVI